MNPPPTLQKYRDQGLKPHQAALVDDVLLAPIPSRYLLIAAPGYGKTTAAMFAAKEIAKAKADHRILLIGPQLLLAMYERQLTQAMPESRVLMATRRFLRELEAGTELDGTIWPTAAVVVVDIGTARQQDVLHHFCSANWNLVLIQEVNLCGWSNWILLKAIIKKASFEKVLMTTTVPKLKGITELLKTVTRIDWSAPQLVDWDGRPLLASKSATFKTVAYERSEMEVSVARNLLALTASLKTNPFGQMVKRVLLKQASSSLLALERTLRQLRTALVHTPALLHPHKPESAADVRGDWSGTDADLGSIPRARSVWHNKSGVLAAIDDLLEQVGSVTSDQKLEALEKLIDKLRLDNQLRICVFCSSRVTASYLEIALAERGGNVWRLTGEYSPEQTNLWLEGFRRDNGILIATIPALQGFDLRETQAFIHYDPPATDAEMRIRATQVPSRTHYLLKDESGVLHRDWDETVQ